MKRNIPNGIDARKPFASCQESVPTASRLTRKGGLTMFRHFQHTVLLIAITLLSTDPRSLRAQVSTADIIGTVTDQAGAVITDATVTVENADTRERRSETTGAAGEFVFNLLQPGRYTISVQSKGFKTATTTLTVSAGDRARAPRLGRCDRRAGVDPRRAA